MRLHAVIGIRGKQLMPPATLLDNAKVVHHDRVEPTAVAFTGGRVAQRTNGAIRLNLRDHLVFAGLINAHDHLQLNNVPPVEHAAPFPNSYVWIDAMAAHRQRPDVSASTNVPAPTRHWHGGLKGLLSGTTTVAHHDPWNAVFDDAAFPVHVVRDYGWSHSLGLGGANGEVSYGPEIRESFTATANEHPWIVHLAEGTDDVAHAELARLDLLGCLASNTVLVHGVGLTDADVDRVIEAGAAVVWCPSSNLEMLGATFDPTRLALAGRVALGTDSRLTGSRDLLEEMRIARGHSRLSARELFRLVTDRPSDVLRLRDRGRLVAGCVADCVIVREDGDPYETILRTSRSAIRAVIRDGAPVIADPDFADWFVACDVDTVRVCLDGQPKLAAKRVFRPDAVALEPGLRLGHPDTREAREGSALDTTVRQADPSLRS